MKRSLRFEVLESRSLQSLFTPLVGPVAGATQAGTGVGSVSAALAAHAVSTQNSVNRAINPVNPMPNSMDPIEGSNVGKDVPTNPMDPAQGGNLQLHSVTQ